MQQTYLEKQGVLLDKPLKIKEIQEVPSSCTEFLVGGGLGLPFPSSACIGRAHFCVLCADPGDFISTKDEQNQRKYDTSVVFLLQTLWRKKGADFGASVVTWVCVKTWDETGMVMECKVGFFQWKWLPGKDSTLFYFRSRKITVSERTNLVRLKCYIWSIYSVSSFIVLKKRIGWG